MRAFARIIQSLAGVVLLALLAAASVAHAVEPDEVLGDAKLEARARHLSAELRCLVCQNQSIDESNAPLARDLRQLVRERLQAGDSDEAVRAFVVARYGKFVLLRPPLGPETILLWATPAIVLIMVATAVLWRLRRMRSVAAPRTPLSAAEQARLEQILKDSS